MRGSERESEIRIRACGLYHTPQPPSALSGPQHAKTQTPPNIFPAPSPPPSLIPRTSLPPPPPPVLPLRPPKTPRVSREGTAHSAPHAPPARTPPRLPRPRTSPQIPALSPAGVPQKRRHQTRSAGSTLTPAGLPRPDVKSESPPASLARVRSLLQSCSLAPPRAQPGCPLPSVSVVSLRVARARCRTRRQRSFEMPLDTTSGARHKLLPASIRILGPHCASKRPSYFSFEPPRVEAMHVRLASLLQQDP